MILERRPYKDVYHIWQGIYSSVFGRLADQRPPDFVYLFVTDDGKDLMGFVAYNELSPSEVIIRWGGATEKFRGKFRNLNFFKQLLKKLHQIHRYRYISIVVENLNKPMLRMALMSDFRIMGARVDTGGKVWVEMLKEEENGSKLHSTVQRDTPEEEGRVQRETAESGRTQ